ncbi:MAG: hypothetical protein Q8N61_01700 [bacterium]|nr:hypothetical protein [bacterium]
MQKKSDYKRLLGYLSSARKTFSRGWRPDILADDTRSAVLMQRRGLYTLYLRGWGMADEQDWLDRLVKEVNCPLDRWVGQPNYVEVYFEAAAMAGQFFTYADENVPLLAFHGDISIPAKWEATVRLVRRWRDLNKPVRVLYYGDFDDKGLQIPQSAENDIRLFAPQFIGREAQRNGEVKADGTGPWMDEAKAFLEDFDFIRVGLNDDHIARFNIPENPERPGTYQWEGLSDAGAQTLIARVNDYLDLAAFERVKKEEQDATERFREHIRSLRRSP